MSTKHILINGDSRHMSLIPKESVHLIVTSPPYWQLKDYGNNRQIGFNDTYEQYINSLNLVWQECYRILQSGCRLCINIGDQFARTAYYGRYKVVPIHSEIIRFCETIGFDLNKFRVDEINSGHDSTLEVEDELLNDAINNHGFRCTTNIEDLKDFRYNVENKRYFGDEYDKSIEYILDGEEQILYVFYIEDMIVIQVGLSDEGPKFIAYR